MKTHAYRWNKKSNTRRSKAKEEFSFTENQCLWQKRKKDSMKIVLSLNAIVMIHGETKYVRIKYLQLQQASLHERQCAFHKCTFSVR